MFYVFATHGTAVWFGLNLLPQNSLRIFQFDQKCMKIKMSYLGFVRNNCETASAPTLFCFNVIIIKALF